MRVGIQTWGTEGDVRPFLALGSALRARGHEVRLVYTNIESRDFKALGAACGVEASPVGADYFDENRERLAARASEGFEVRNPLRQVERIIEDLLDPVADRMLEAGRALARESDVFVSHFLAYPGHVAAELEGCKHAVVGLVPILPSSSYAPIGMPSLGRLLRGLQWRLSGWILESLFGPRINALRLRAGLPPLRGVVDPGLERAHLALIAVSPTLFPRPDDWSPRAHVCGSLSLPDQAEPWEPDPALGDFLEGGPAPVFLSFGSMFNLDARRTARAVATLGEAVELAGQRGIIQAPEAVVREAPRRGCVRYITRAPHALLFPRCSAVVHHGGAGTTQSALLAGKPSVVVPHAADQFYWGDTLARLGAGVEPLRVTRLTAERLASRLREVAERPRLAARAAALGRSIAGERGPERAAELIERSAPG